MLDWQSFTKDTALSEKGRGAAWHGRGTAWARHVMCESAFRYHNPLKPNVSPFK